MAGQLGVNRVNVDSLNNPNKYDQQNASQA